MNRDFSRKVSVRKLRTFKIEGCVLEIMIKFLN